jgi:hypothetical protein
MLDRPVNAVLDAVNYFTSRPKPSLRPRGQNIASQDFGKLDAGLEKAHDCWY